MLNEYLNLKKWQQNEWKDLCLWQFLEKIQKLKIINR